LKLFSLQHTAPKRQIGVASIFTLSVRNSGNLSLSPGVKGGFLTDRQNSSIIEQENSMNRTAEQWTQPASFSGRIAQFRAKKMRANVFRVLSLFRFLFPVKIKSIMSRKERNKMLMYKSVHALLHAHPEKLRRVPVFQELKTELLELIDQIELLEKGFMRVAPGRSGDRIQTEEKAFDLLIPVCFALYSYARKTADEGLMAKTLFHENNLRTMKSEELLSKADALAEEAFAHEKDLAPYGICREIVREMQACVRAHTGTLDSRCAGIAAFLRARGAMTLLFEQADELLEEDMDRVIEIFRQSETKFYNQYFSVRDAHETIGRNIHQPFLAPSEPQTV